MSTDRLNFAVLVSANAEWDVVKSGFPNAHIEKSSYGEYFFDSVDGEKVLFCHGGWGKVAAAASTQYFIDHFNPEYLINIGTCGGVEGRVRRFDVIVPDRVVVYDIYPAMAKIHAKRSRITRPNWICRRIFPHQPCAQLYIPPTAT
jgi:adenosylhomocysteine nucleosidase